MKKSIILPILVLEAMFFLVLTNFKFQSDVQQSEKTGAGFMKDSTWLHHSHDVFNDYRPNLVTPPYVYYPPTSDNPLTYTNVDITNNTAPQNEPSVRVSRKDPNRVVAAWRDFRIGTNPAVRRVGYSYSTNGGTTWATTALIDSTLLGGGLLRNSDASVTSDTAGNFYITTIGLNNSNGNDVLAIFKSTDGGVTFPSGQVLASGASEDKEMVTCDNVQGSPYLNNIYISWSRLALSPDIRLIRSTNGGQTWSTPANVSSSATDGQGSDPAVGANGEVYVVWNGGFGVDVQEFNKSTDGGLTFGTPVAVASGPSPNVPFSQSGFTAFPSIACDVSGGPRSGYIYVSWCDNRNADADVFISRSTDHGNTWSSALRVNNDGLGNGKCQAWPWIAVNNQGLISIVFYDTRNTPSNNIIEAWMARSSDGGLTFTNEVLSTQQSPTNEPNSDVRFGDYIGNDFWTNKIVPVWTDERAGGFDMEIYTANIDILSGINPVVNTIPSQYELRQNYPNPFNPSTKINFSLPKQSNIELSIFDINGQLVSKVYEGEMNAGEHSITWDGGKVSSGIYFYRLTTNGFTETKKMMLIK